MNFNRYLLPDIESDLLGLVDVVVIGPAADDRSAALPRRWSSRFRGSVKCLPYDVRAERCGWTDVSLADETARRDSRPTMDIAELYSVLETSDFANKNVLIDFTGIEQPGIFFLLKCLQEGRKVRRVFGLYTEPLQYKTFPGSLAQEEFDLTEEFIEFRALPGFLRPYDRRKGRQLLVYMGFEGRRFIKLIEEVNPEPRHTHAMFGIPAFQPGWQYLTLGCNQAALERSRARLHGGEAADAFDAYDVASAVSQANPDLQLVLAPIGTKPHAVGAALFAIRNEDTLLIYDFPIKQRLFRTVGVGRTSVYNLSELLFR